jgi:hypothetical protein
VERRRRLAREAEMIAEARADFDAGRLVGSATVKAWIDSIGTELLCNDGYRALYQVHPDTSRDETDCDATGESCRDRPSF